MLIVESEFGEVKWVKLSRDEMILFCNKAFNQGVVQLFPSNPLWRQAIRNGLHTSQQEENKY